MDQKMRHEDTQNAKKHEGRAIRATARPNCASCLHFRCDPLEIERAIPGLLSFGSGYAAVRDGDGLCARHERYLAASSVCAEWRSKD